MLYEIINATVKLKIFYNPSFPVVTKAFETSNKKMEVIIQLKKNNYEKKNYSSILIDGDVG